MPYEPATELGKQIHSRALQKKQREMGIGRSGFKKEVPLPSEPSLKFAREKLGELRLLEPPLSRKEFDDLETMINESSFHCDEVTDFLVQLKAAQKQKGIKEIRDR